MKFGTIGTDIYYISIDRFFKKKNKKRSRSSAPLII